MIGLAKSLNRTRNYGFIRVEGEREYFFHRQDYLGDWDSLVEDFEYLSKEHTPIELDFTPVDSPKGPRAGVVSRLDLKKTEYA